MEKPTYKLSVFEGPLDLLLHLISVHRLNIHDIPILELVGQYMSYVEAAQSEDLYVASEFLEMAARLVYLKSASLLPAHEEADELKRELTGELLEYRDCKKIAQELSLRTAGFDLFVREPMTIEADAAYTRLHEAGELLNAYLAAAGKGLRKLPPPIEAFRDLLTRKLVSVASKFGAIFQKLAGAGKRRKLRELFSDAVSRSDMVATFLALLELARTKKVKIIGDGGEADIELLKPDFDGLVSEEWE